MSPIFLSTPSQVYVAAVIPGMCRYRYLMQYHAVYGYWCLPGGKPEHYETRVSALVRELREELGIQLTAAPRPLLRIENERVGKLWVGYHYLVTAYEGVPRNAEPHKFSKLLYLTADEIKELDSFGYRAILEAQRATI